MEAQFEKAQKLEKELLVALKKSGALDPATVELRRRLRSAYEQILISDVAFATSKDIDHSLWKNVFYKAIEEYRSTIKKTQAAVAASGGSGSGSGDQQHSRLSDLMCSFQSFLNDSISFYELLVRRLRAMIDAKAPLPHPNVRKCAMNSVYKTMISLGDLARYRELYRNSERVQSDFSLARKFYFDALALLPDNGNPHNQLAVLATYEDRELEAIYRYCRALAVKRPFLSARDNLVVLFEKNRAKLQAIAAPPTPTPPAKSPSRPSGGKKKQQPPPPPPPITVDPHALFLLRFIRLHGLLFSRIDLDTFDDVLSAALRDVTDILGSGTGPSGSSGSDGGSGITEEAMLQCCVMAIFSAEFAPQSCTEPSQRALVARLSHSLAIEFFAKVLHSVRPEHVVYLAPILLVLQWTRANIRSFAPTAADPSEARHRVRYLEAVASLLNVIQENGSPFGMSDAEESRMDALPEDVELCGFLPTSTTSSSSWAYPPTPAPSTAVSPSMGMGTMPPGLPDEVVHFCRRVHRIKAWAAAMSSTTSEDQQEEKAPFVFDANRNVFHVSQAYGGTASPVPRLLPVAPAPVASSTPTQDQQLEHPPPPPPPYEDEEENFDQPQLAEQNNARIPHDLGISEQQHRHGDEMIDDVGEGFEVTEEDVEDGEEEKIVFGGGLIDSNSSVHEQEQELQDTVTASFAQPPAPPVAPTPTAPTAVSHQYSLALEMLAAAKAQSQQQHQIIEHPFASPMLMMGAHQQYQQYQQPLQHVASPLFVSGAFGGGQQQGAVTTTTTSTSPSAAAPHGSSGGLIWQSPTPSHSSSSVGPLASLFAPPPTSSTSPPPMPTATDMLMMGRAIERPFTQQQSQQGSPLFSSPLGPSSWLGSTSTAASPIGTATGGAAAWSLFGLPPPPQGQQPPQHAAPARPPKYGS